MRVHPTIAGSKLAKLLVEHVEAGGSDPSVSIAKMILGEQFHPVGEYDLKPIRMMRSFLDDNPKHKLSKAANWESDMVWMDAPDEPKVEEPETPDLPVEVTAPPIEDTQPSK